jgi:HEPN domain-containing protein
MRRSYAAGRLALVGLVALAGCGESGTQPGVDRLTLAQRAELAVLADAGAVDVAAEINAASIDVAESFAISGVSEGRTYNAQAIVDFAAARERLNLGDERGALDAAREARRKLARAVLATGGPDAVLALIERLEDLIEDLGTEDEDVFDDPEGLAAKLTALAAEARELFARGDYVRAAERALFGEQIIRFHRGRRDFPGDILPARARLAVDLAAAAVTLAEHLIATDSVPVRELATIDVTTHRNRWLAHARRMLAMAQHALEQGHLLRAVHFAEHAQWSALKAVILPGGITEAELRAMVRVANRLHAAAVVEVGEDGTELQNLLLARAGRLIARGESMLADGNKRGVVPVWRGAVISRWLIG